MVVVSPLAVIRRAEGVMADVIQQHGLVRYPIECACGENFRRSQDWGRHVAEAMYEALEAAGVKRKRRTPSPQ